MDFEEICARWRANLAGVIDVRELKELSRSGDMLCYECPCRRRDHVAMRLTDDLRGKWTLCDILTCFVSRQQWLIRTDVADIIRDEEQKYFDLLAKAPAVIRKVRAKHQDWDRERLLAYLLDTHGIDPEIAGELIER